MVLTNVYELGNYGIAPWGSSWGNTVGFNDTTAKWIWYTPNANVSAPNNKGSPVNIQYTYTNNTGSPITARLKFITDNYATVKLNNTVLFTDKPEGGQPSDITLISGNNLLEFYIWNDGAGPAGLVVSVSNTNNSILFNSNSSWSYIIADPPTNIIGIIGNGQVSLSWTAPANNGGYTISNYNVQYSSDNGGTWLAFNRAPSTATLATVTGLTNGTSYIFQVAAVNAIGTGAYSTVFTLYSPGLNYKYVSGYFNDNPNFFINKTGITGNNVNNISNLSNGVNTDSRAHVNGENFSIEWTGFFKPTHTGKWTFKTSSDDSSLLWIGENAVNNYANGQNQPINLLVDNRGTHSDVPKEGTINLTKDFYYPIRIQFGELTGGQAMFVSFRCVDANNANNILVQETTNGTNYYWVSQSGTFSAVTIPRLPTNLTVTRGNTSASLTWTAPANNGDLAISYYTIQYSVNGGSSWTDFSNTVNTNITVTGLTNGTSYVFRVAAINSVNIGTTINTTNYNFSNTDPVIPATIPGLPTITAVTRGNSEVNLTWTAPASNGGSAITDYIIQYSVNSGTLWTTFQDTVNTNTTTTVTGLTNGTSYVFRVAAVNSVNSGTTINTTNYNFSNTDPVIPATIPGLPTITAVTRGNSEVNLTWTAPASNGGSAITDYVIQYSVNSGTSWTTFQDTVNTNTTTTVTGLTNGTSYVFRVAAINSVNIGTTINTTNYNFSNTGSVVPATIPGLPTITEVTRGNSSVSLKWTAPTSNGGFAISYYIIQYSVNQSNLWTTFSDTGNTNITVTSLTNGTSYVFRVAAINSVNYNTTINTTNYNFSNQMDPVIPATIPGLPTITAVTRGNSEVNLTWTAPASNGGSAITDYVIQYYTSGSWTTFPDTVNTDTTATVTSLTNGTNYLFRVAAVNSVNHGTTINPTNYNFSNQTGSVTPATAPGLPTITEVTRGNSSASLKWTAPTSNGGSAITDYIIQYSVNQSNLWTTFQDTVNTNTATTVTGLTNGTSYVFRVAAVNSVNYNTTINTTNYNFSNQSDSVIPATAPGLPTNVIGTLGNSSASLTWTTPSNNGGSAITDYVIQYSVSGSNLWTTFIDGNSTNTRATVTGLTNGTSYVFRVAAVNLANNSAVVNETNYNFSNQSDFVIPATAPGLPTNVTGTLGNSSASLTWTAPENNGGSAITDYIIQYSINETNSWITFTDGNSTDNRATVTNLINGTSYVFRVAAVNSVNNSAVINETNYNFSNQSDFVIPATAPGLPTNVIGTLGNSSASLTWTAPENNGGSEVSDYVIQYSVSGSNLWTTFTDGNSTNTRATVTGLTNGTSYVFRVAAVNLANNSAVINETNYNFSNQSDFVIPATAPGLPTNVIGTLGNSSASLTWTAPENNGGSEVSDYVIQYSVNNGSSWTTFQVTVNTNTTATVTGLTNGTSYVFRVAAVNSVNNSAVINETNYNFSNQSDSVIPVGPPDKPTITGITTGNSTVTLSWTTPVNNGGLAISDYIIQYSINSSGTWATFLDEVNTNNSATVTGLNNGNNYIFQVAAVNSSGAGNFSSSSSVVTPASAPAEPTNISVAPIGNGAFNLSWVPPNDNGRVIKDYIVQFSNNNGANWYNVNFKQSTNISGYKIITRCDDLFNLYVGGTEKGSGNAWNITYEINTSKNIDDVISVFAQNNAGPGGYIGTFNGIGTKFIDWKVTPQQQTGWNNNNFNDSNFKYPIVIGTNSSNLWGVTANIPLDAEWMWYESSTYTQTPLYFRYSPAEKGEIQNNSVNISKLLNGTNYNFRVAAINDLGQGPYSTSTSQVSNQISIPSAPTGITGVTGNNQVVLSWLPPTNNGGMTISNYIIEYSSNNGIAWTQCAINPASSDTTRTINGLVNGTNYIFRVAAINSNGSGSYSSNSSQITPCTTPGQPYSVQGISGNGQVSLSWTAPTDNGGNVISNYKIMYSSDDTSWSDFEIIPASTITNKTVTGLSNGTNYIFKVAAINNKGQGTFSLNSSQIKPLSPPEQPTGIQGTGGNGQVSLTWIAPLNNGGKDITNYIIQYLSDGDTWKDFIINPVSTSTSKTVIGLTNGTNYIFKVAAINEKGTGTYSNISGQITPSTTPGQPSGVTGTIDNNKVNLSWIQPIDNGGMSITNYEIEYSVNNGRDWTLFSISPASTSTNKTVTGLTNGLSYIFKVAAINANGTGTYSSNSSQITPATQPSQPRNLFGKSLTGQVILTWLEPSNLGGSPIIKYIIKYSSNNGMLLTSIDTQSTLTTKTVNGLTNGTTYKFSVIAVNVAGDSVNSNEISVEPGLPPSPSNVSGTPENNKVLLEWTVPQNYDGPQITDYVIQYSSTNGYYLENGSYVLGDAGWENFSHTASTSLNIEVSGLLNGTAYIFRVAAVNEIGTGDFGPPSDQIIPATIPTPPLNITGNISNNQINLSWNSPTSNGGKDISNYLVEYKKISENEWTPYTDYIVSTNTFKNISGLLIGVQYKFRIKAVNSIGPSNPSNESNSYKPITYPEKPTSILAIPNNSSISLTWNEPSNIGGDEIINYLIKYSSNPVNESSWVNFIKQESSDRNVSVPGLVNGTGYSFKVAAVNSLGEGEYSSQTSVVTPADKPNKPTNIILTRGNGQVTLQWNTPITNGSSISNYIIEYLSVTDTNWSLYTSGTVINNSIVVNGLTNGLNYIFKIAFVNSAGASLYSDTTDFIMPATTPNAPTGLNQISKNNSIELNWIAPEINGGFPIFDYKIEYFTSITNEWINFTHTPSINTNILVTGLSNGTSYIFKISAENFIGIGSSLVSTDPIKPGILEAPTNVYGTAQNLAISLNWEAPQDINNSLLNYKIEKSSDGTNWSEYNKSSNTNNNEIISGLTNGVSYIFRVYAINNSGISFPSQTSLQVIPGIAPNIPTNLTALSNSSQISLSWSEPINNGLSIVNYIVQYSNDESTWSDFNKPISSNTTFDTSDILSGLKYTFRVAAVNSVGIGSFSTNTPFIYKKKIALNSDLVEDFNLFQKKAIAKNRFLNTSIVPITLKTNFSDIDLVGETYYNNTNTQSNIQLYQNIKFKSPPNSITAVVEINGVNDMVATNIILQKINNLNGTLKKIYKITNSSQSGKFEYTHTNQMENIFFAHFNNQTGEIDEILYGTKVNNIYTFDITNFSVVAAYSATAPGAPTNLTGTRGNTSASLTWTTPSNNGGSEITDYLIQYSVNGSNSWDTYTDGISTGTAVTVNNLINGTSYIFRVAAVNSVNNGADINETNYNFSNQTGSVIPATIPSSPTNLTGTRGNTSTELTWTAPSNNGGSEITDYIIQYSVNGSSSWDTYTDGTSTDTTATVNNLTNGTSYIFRVTAVNSVNNGSAINETNYNFSNQTGSVIPATIPGYPTNVNVTRGDSLVSLTWTAPSSNGGSEITDYLIQYSVNESSSWDTYTDGISTGTTATVTGLTNGTSYIFRVAAINSVNDGAVINGTNYNFRNQTGSVIPATVPNSPTNLDATRGNSLVSLTWTAPSNNGGSEITDYIIQYSVNGSSSWTTYTDGTSTGTTATVNNLTNGTSYIFRVTAVNSVNNSSAINETNYNFSNQTGSIIPATIPGYPTNVNVTRGDSLVSLTWTAPSSNGGYEITDYLIQYSVNESSSWDTYTDGISTGTTATVTGLTNGTSYIFRVAAVNSVNNGVVINETNYNFSNLTSSVIPATIPDSPTNVNVTRGDSLVSLTWTAPSNNGGSEINDYIIQYSVNGSNSWDTYTDGTSTDTTATVNNLTNGTSYIFRVTAVNSVNNGSAINEANYNFSNQTGSIIPATIPSSPTNINVTRGDSLVSLTWSAPSNNGGSEITDYLIQYSVNGSNSWDTYIDGTSTDTITTVNNLINGTSYIFRVAAVNSVNNGVVINETNYNFSNLTSSVIPATIPDSPTNLDATRGDSLVSLTWTAPANNGGFTITDYLIQYSVNGSNSWDTYTDGISTNTSTTVNNLINGTSYIFRVAAVNSVNNGAVINGTNYNFINQTGSVIPATIPGAPINLVSTRGNSLVELSWDTSINDGGLQIFDYIIQYSINDDNSWTLYEDGINNNTTATVNNLTNGTRYIFRIAAVNSVGASDYSTNINAVIPATIPNAPTSLSATTGDSLVTLTWSTPLNTGGLDIIGYSIIYSINNGSNWSLPISTNSTLTTFQVNNLTNRTSYVFRVAAVNSVGPSQYSTSTNSVIPNVVPGIPSGISTLAGDRQVKLTWTVPINYGTDITNYKYKYSYDTTTSSTITMTNSSIITNGNGTKSYIITDLTNGTNYTFQLAAVNLAGDGAFSTPTGIVTPEITQTIRTLSEFQSGLTLIRSLAVVNPSTSIGSVNILSDMLLQAVIAQVYYNNTNAISSLSLNASTVFKSAPDSATVFVEINSSNNPTTTTNITAKIIERGGTIKIITKIMNTSGTGTFEYTNSNPRELILLAHINETTGEIDEVKFGQIVNGVTIFNVDRFSFWVIYSIPFINTKSGGDPLICPMFGKTFALASHIKFVNLLSDFTNGIFINGQVGILQPGDFPQFIYWDSSFTKTSDISHVYANSYYRRFYIRYANEELIIDADTLLTKAISKLNKIRLVKSKPKTGLESISFNKTYPLLESTKQIKIGFGPYLLTLTTDLNTDDRHHLDLLITKPENIVNCSGAFISQDQIIRISDIVGTELYQYDSNPFTSIRFTN
jgi:hypothetical protein